MLISEFSWLLEDLYYFTILLLYYLVKVKWEKIYQCTCVYIGVVHLYIKSDFYHLTFAFRFITPNHTYEPDFFQVFEWVSSMELDTQPKPEILDFFRVSYSIRTWNTRFFRVSYSIRTRKTRFFWVSILLKKCFFEF